MPADEEILPIFPLSNAVLFPGLSTPLHLFEPRYRQMAREALASEGRIGMVVVRPEFTDDMPGNPPLFPVGCAGTIRESQRLPDGRYDIVLEGDVRFRILEELPRGEERLYRVARVLHLEDHHSPADAPRIARLRQSIIEDVAILVRRSQPDRAEALRPELFAGVDDVTFVNLLSNAFALPVEEKQALLEADTITERYARLASLLRFQRVELDAGVEGGSGRLH